MGSLATGALVCGARPGGEQRARRSVMAGRVVWRGGALKRRGESWAGPIGRWRAEAGEGAGDGVYAHGGRRTAARRRPEETRRISWASERGGERAEPGSPSLVSSSVDAL